MLVTLKTLLTDAKKQQRAVGAFNAPNLETIRAAIEAAEELQSPVILQHAEGHDSLIPLAEIGPIMLDYAKRATVPVAVHLDHGASFDACLQAIRLGFTSIMYDASSKAYQDNLKETKEIVKIAHSVGVSVEAELGHIFTSALGGGEGRAVDPEEVYDDVEAIYTDPEIAKEFVLETEVDCLAIAFGTVHGVYLKEPKLDLPRIKKIRDATALPLVMHGGSGVSEADYRTAIANGICKINYYTYGNQAGGRAVADYIRQVSTDDQLFFEDVVTSGTAGIKADLKAAMAIFKNTI
ncbi:class II fructose-bisphosphate aldolase [Vagococcus sp. BWB3-3]|uniref:Class II fructose-bisphosphate aldolase n=1 Tax=Vagococcus allomyrinae TaxID=2794353 RepID=A0A940SXF0_9ENTE|nr:class II fructose-bisphosphate aldolase [Vagococcus allomyrinae]MBP1042298.1 class II fructose-bisphosphate aldolase [Vagococcus allomyrinae]